MSATLSLCCDDCKVGMPVGKNTTVYGDPDDSEHIRRFMEAHLGHRLWCGNSEETFGGRQDYEIIKAEDLNESVWRSGKSPNT